MKRIKDLSDIAQIYLYATLIQILIFLILSFCFFIGWSEIPLGWALGSLACNLNFFLIGLSADSLLSTKSKTRYYSALYYVLRMLIVVIVLTLPLLLAHFDIHIFNIIATFLALLTIKCVIIFISKKGD